jgi:two-component system chemotaxis sensor kinase CheA
VLDLSKLKDAYVSETADHLQSMNAGLLELEKNPKAGKEVLDELMRSAHTMKSSSATMGFVKTAFLTHVMEDVFDRARTGTGAITAPTVDTLFTALDALEASLASVRKAGKESVDESIAVKLQEDTGVTTKGVGKSPRTPEGLPITFIEKTTHIKVPVERLDTLMETVEELIVDKMKLEELKKRDRELAETVDHVGSLISNLRYHVTQARLVPLEQIFARFPRMVRDLAHKEKKDVTFEMTGGEIEIDRAIVDTLAEPLTHLLRNAVDHGITERGKISLSALREKQHLIISIQDDGTGVDWQKMIETAVTRGLLDKEKAKSLSRGIQDPAVRDEIVNLVLRHRISTSDTVTETSGRGFGLSIVKDFADRMGGRFMVESPPEGKGSRFVLELPSTLAIFEALLVGVGDTVFAIPFSVIERSVIVLPSDIKSMADQDIALIDGQNAPIVRLATLFGLSSTVRKRPSDGSETAVVLRRGSAMTCIVVDTLVSEQEIVMKPLPGVFSGVKGFSGSTVLGDGRTILVIDVNSLLDDPKKFVRTGYAA